jgi:hypothetical protein
MKSTTHRNNKKLVRARAHTIQYVNMKMRQCYGVKRYTHIEKLWQKRTDIIIKNRTHIY